MPEQDDVTQQVLDTRARMDDAKTHVIESRTQVTSAEDQLAAADDAIRSLDLDPDRDLARQVARLLTAVREDLTHVEGRLDEADKILGREGT